MRRLVASVSVFALSTGVVLVPHAFAQPKPSSVLVSPSNGDTVTTTDLPVRVQVSNLTVSAADVGLPDKEGEVHIHVMLDGMNMGVLLNFYTSPTFTLPGPKLANAAKSSAVQHSSSNDPTAINVPAGVDFAPIHVLTAGASGFPPAAAAAGAVGNPGYTPLVLLPNGVVVNASQIGDGTNTNGSDKAHWADKAETVDSVHRTVTYDITNGCYEDQSVHYVSFYASNPTAAAIEDVTFAPTLGGLPFADCGTNDINQTPPFIAPGCARESLIAFINGQTGTDNIQRQGLNAAILDQESPLNILEDVPNDGGQFDYSPMWDIHLLQWKASVPLANRVRQTDFRRAAALVGSQAQSIAPDGGPSKCFPVDWLHCELSAHQHFRQQLTKSAEV